MRSAAVGDDCSVKYNQRNACFLNPADEIYSNSALLRDTGIDTEEMCLLPTRKFNYNQLSLLYIMGKIKHVSTNNIS